MGVKADREEELRLARQPHRLHQGPERAGSETGPRQMDTEVRKNASGLAKQ